MSIKKPNLTIEIEQFPQQCNSKFKGYVQYPQPSYEDNTYQQNDDEGGGNRGSRVTRISHQSNKSNISDRSSLLERAQKCLIESRLADNIKSLSTKKFKTMSNSKLSDNEHEEFSARNGKKQSGYRRKEGQKQRIKNNSNGNSLENSRAKILGQIAEKLKKIENYHRGENQNQSKSYLGKRKQYRNQTAEKRVQKIGSGKQHQQQQEEKQQLCKTKRGKLEDLLKDIKKSNKEAYKVVYTIKKSVTGTGVLEKSVQVKDGEMKKNTVPTKIEENHGEDTNGVGEGVPPVRHNHHRNLIDYSNMNDLRKLTEQLHNVRMQLKQVKTKNEQLYTLSQLKQNIDKNIDTSSQSSRLTKQIQALQLDVESTGSNLVNRIGGYIGGQSSLQPSFNRPQRYYEIGSGNGEQSYVVIRESDIVQACFACGCTCRGRRDIGK